MAFSEIIEIQTPGLYIKRRYILAIMCSFGLLNMYSTRNNINIAIVAMVNVTTSYAKSQNFTEICPGKNISFEETRPVLNGIFTWNSAEQGLVMGSYFYGYLLTNIPGAWLARKYGFKLVLGASSFISSFLTILLPFVAYRSFKLLIALRICIGFIQGVSFPTVLGVWSKWSPPLERSILTCLSTSGAYLGIVFVYSVGGAIASKWGWEAIFYFTGCLTLLWSVLWFFTVHDEPMKHPNISEQERVYIRESIAAESCNDENEDDIPWKKIFLSKPVLAITIAAVTNTFGDYVLSTMLPTYMATILNCDLTMSGIVVALPYVLKSFTVNAAGYVTDLVRSKGWVSTNVARKVNQTIASVGPAICVLLACYVGCNVTASVTFFFLAIGFIGFSVPGYETNSIDIHPKYAGIIYSIPNAISSCCGFISPQIAGLILMGGNNLAQWKLVFWTTAGVFFVGCISYLALASADIQNWTRGDKADISEGELLEKQ